MVPTPEGEAPSSMAYSENTIREAWMPVKTSTVFRMMKLMAVDLPAMFRWQPPGGKSCGRIRGKTKPAFDVSLGRSEELHRHRLPYPAGRDQPPATIRVIQF